LVAGAAIVGSVVLIVTARSRQTVGADLPETAPGRVGRLVLDRPLQRPAPTLQDLRRAA
ncbi:MAG: hypothetical protein QOE36_3774, partial [Gaiellaceae bacterium]|nr:hypothetical protein [Gaiellaceae bacterium]